MFKKITIFAFLLLSFIALANTPDIYCQIRVPWGYEDKVPAEVISSRPGVWADYAIPESGLALLRARVVPFEVIIPDMSEFYASRLDERLDMGGWRTYEMILAALDSLHDRYPAYVSEPESIGVGCDGHKIVCVKVSDNVETDEDEPEVLIAGGIHAREVIAPEVVLSFAQWLLDSMTSSKIALHMVEKREIWIIPLLNPDGYFYNQETNPTGGGMWRKNRRDNGDGTWGVDLNRNFTYMWGYDDFGSSSDPSDETYRGSFAGSELETQAIMDFVDSREFRSSMSFHSYSNYYLFPFGWTYDLPIHNDWFLRVGYRYARGNGYIYGPSASTIYVSNGDTDDWLYGDTTGHSWIFCCTPEVGGDGDGFWPALSRKDQLVSENMLSCKVCCQIAGSAPFMVQAWVDPLYGDSSGYADPGERSRILVEIENLGFDPSTAYIKAFSATSGLDMIDDSVFVGAIASQGYDTVGFVIEIDETRILPGDYVKIKFEICDTSGYSTYDSTSFACGTPMIISEWDFEAGAGSLAATGDWQWGAPTSGPEAAFSGDFLWATKIADDYTNNTLSELLLPDVAIPSSSYKPRFSLKHWYSFEAPSGGDIYDGATVMISDDGGLSWSILSSVEGYDGVAYDHNPYLDGDSVFTGSSVGWRTETFDIEPYAGSTILIKLVIGSDPYVSASGWYVDDIKFIYYLDPGLAAGAYRIPDNVNIDIYPNPFNSACRIFFHSKDSIFLPKIEIFDLDGRIVREFEGCDIIWDGRDRMKNELPTGVYLARFTHGNIFVTRKLLLVK
ncbi:T9SS type A sorting domain-containing protein [bacterium]|nr:T9SS type A sorting domain-containing protein [bacterium]